MCSFKEIVTTISFNFGSCQQFFETFDNLVYFTIQAMQDYLENDFILSILKANNQLLDMTLLLISASLRSCQYLEFFYKDLPK